MKTIFFSFLFFFSLLVLTSCSSDDFDSPEDKNINNRNADTESDGTQLIEFIYKGKLYSSTYIMTTDSLIILDDNKANEVYQSLTLNPNLATLIKNEGIPEYFDSYEEILQSKIENSLNGESTLRSSLRSYGVIAFTVDFYEDSSWKGKKISFTADKNKLRVYVPDLRAYGLDNKISSVKYKATRGHFNGLTTHDDLVLATFTLFQYFDYKGKSVTIIDERLMGGDRTSSSWEGSIRRLKDVPFQGGGNWNDSASSIIIGYRTN